ncbi:putative sodium-dependent multivitamin transporter isoform X6 [Schistocerca nitens]|uniref:putative sodium-dependent multivitamin transporter isoform X4 n=1 Tax=Schistocerca nitens TaxID=7011 RepID=UPI002117C843|nr:putative sodium-dependent multivitamin transporter isoform X4 [Schistocerca nitens]XP_049797290.1 putative sodium-dependent multivitamin transporter isoform X6 [Schistocerca nitens]
MDVVEAVEGDFGPIERATAQTATLGVWDYVVLVAMLVISMGIGVYYRFTGGRQKTTQEYLLGDRSLGAGPVAFSLMASFMSAITLLGVSSENFVYGAQFIAINLGYGLVTPVAAYLFLPVFFRLQAASAYQYLEMRFGVAARLCASIAFSLQMVLYMGIVLYAPALAIRATTGLDENASILAVGLICTFYSTIGGMKAVVITDVFQSLLMFAAVFLVSIKGSIDAGGFDKVWEIATTGGRADFSSISADPTVRHTWWSLIIGGGFTYLCLYAVNQTQVQRLLSTRDLATAQRALWWSWPVLSLLSLTTSFAGLAMYSYYYTCDPLTSKRIERLDQLMPLYVVDTMSGMPGLPGLFIAGIFSGSLSTVSSAVNSLAAVTLEDYFKPLYVQYRGHPLGESRSPLVGKLLALVFGLLFLGLAFMAQFLGGVLQASLTIFGAVGGPVLGFFSLGMFLPHANEPGAITGLATGLAFSMWVGFGVPQPDAVRLPTRTDGCDFNVSATPPPPTQDPSEYFYLYRVSYLWVVVLGFLLTLVVGAVASWVAGVTCKGDHSVPPPDPDLFVPPVRRALLARRGRRGSNPVQLTRVAGDLSNGVGPAADTKSQEEPLNGIGGHHVTSM